MYNNKVTYIGRITKDIEIKESKAGKSYVNFSIAVNLPKEMVHTDENGKSVNADFFNCVAFGTTAKLLAEHTHKGSRVQVHGSQHEDKYTTKDGTKVYGVKLFVDEVGLLDPKPTKADESVPVKSTKQMTNYEFQTALGGDLEPGFGANEEDYSEPDDSLDDFIDF